MTGTFTNHPRLIVALPPLVRKQRRLAAKLAAVADQIPLEKAVRAEIDQLLIAAGLQPGDVVTCGPYDVRHNERAGQRWINGDVATEQLVAGGVDRDFAVQVLTAATETGEPAKYATVTVTKGAKVRAA